jgi:predicted ATPase|tara:strand:- start:72 stop:599 length:528 start_codon:yes stop_codon:yes gene_type:complete
MNQKYIITGAPGTGKTAIINALIQKGHSCEKEISREIIAEQIIIGGDILPWENQIAFENHIANLRKQQYLNSSEDKNYFFDRSSIDCIAYLKANKLGVTSEITQIINQCIFNKKVFITPFWEEIYINDGERMEDIKAALNIENSIIETYKSLGYTLVQVPKLSVSERINFILSNI